MPEGVHRDALAKLRRLASAGERALNAARADVLLAISPAWKQIVRWPVHTIVCAKNLEQGLCQWDASILLPFPRNTDEHARAVDVRYPKRDSLRHAQTTGIGRHEHDPVHRRIDGFEELGCFLLAEHHGQLLRKLGVWNGHNFLGPSKRHGIEEPNRAHV